jgi:hypothetical protein
MCLAQIRAGRVHCLQGEEAPAPADHQLSARALQIPSTKGKKVPLYSINKQKAPPPIFSASFLEV